MFTLPQRSLVVRLASLAVLASSSMLIGCGGGSAAVVTSGTTVPPPAVAFSIASVSPKDVPVGSPTVTLIVIGTGFSSSTAVVLNGTSEPTTFVSSTEVHATVAATQLMKGQILSVSAIDGARTAAADTGNNLQVSNPTPTLAAIAPVAALVGSGATSLSVSGTNFVSGAVVDVNGSPRDTAFVSATQLTVTLPAGDLALAGSLLFNVTNPQPAGGASGTDAFLVNNPVPAIASLSPSTAQVGTGATVVTVAGSGFVSGTGVLVNGASRAATVVSPTQIALSLTTADTAQAGSLAITAVNPAPGGGVSGSSALPVNNPAPGALTLAPNAVLAGTTGTTLITVAGTGFVSSTTIAVNGSPRPTTFVSATQVLTSLTAADQATAGTLSLVATTPAPGGGSSAAASVAVNNPAPGSVLVTPNLVATGTPTPTAITVTGANFVPATAVQINGTARTTTYVSSTQLLSMLTVADQAAPGNLSVTAFTPAPGGGTSSASSIAVNNPVLGRLSLSPAVVPAGSKTDITITVSGSGFLPGTAIQVNGTARATTYVNDSQVTFALLAADAASVSRLAVTAVNPAPNSGISPAATLTVSNPAGTPVITSVNPIAYVVGSSDTSLSVYGTNFTQDSIVQWNGNPLVTSFTYGYSYNNYISYLYAEVPAGLLATVGKASVTVYTPSALNATSSAVTVAVTNPPTPTLTSIAPTVGPIATGATITLSGSGFTASSVASFNGKPLATTFVNAGTLTATLTASANLFPGVSSFTVNTPAPGGGTSAAQSFTSYVPIVSNSMIYNPTTGLLYLSIPASAGAPYGNSVVSMDPATGALGKPISVGSEPNKLALTADGKYLWVGLDGASGVRKVDLTAGTAGLQFALDNSASSSGAPTALALLAFPGATDSVIVVQNLNFASVGIYDNGTLRGPLSSLTYGGQYGLQVDSTRAEIYVGGYGLNTYTYNATGLTSKVTNANTGVQLASNTLDDMQLANGKLYGDFGQVYDAEAGILLGTFYQTGTTVAQGPTLYDTAQGKVFILDAVSTSNGYNQIQIFNPANYAAGATSIPISVPSSTYSSSGVYTSFNPHRLVRWGSNGLAFHTSGGVFSLQSNSVKDLSGTLADLAVTVAATGGATTGTSTTYNATITNSGPSTATDVALAIQTPSTGVLTAASSTAGSCSASTSGCSFGSVASGATVTATITVLQTTAGTATLNAQVSGSTTDTVSSNNTGSVSTTVAGSAYSLLPLLSTVTPAAIRSGSADTAVTVTGLNFVAGSTVMLGSTALNTTFISPTQLSAIVPTANLTSMGWSSLTVVTPTPGGGTSNATQLTVYSVLALGATHMVYDPYSRKLMAAVSTGSSSVAGNSLVAITPETATIGSPVVLAAQPTKLALSASGQVLYAALLGTQSIARYNMLTGTADTVAIPVPSGSYYTTPSAYEIAVQPGTDDTLAMSINSYATGFGIYDYSESTKTLAVRPSAYSYYYNGPDCLRFLDPVNLFGNSDGNNLLSFAVNSGGLVSTTGTNYNLNRFGCFKIANGKAYAIQGGVAALNPNGTVNQIGSFTLPNTYSYGSSGAAPVAPDPALGQVFFPGSTTLSNYGNIDGLLSFDSATYLRNGALPLNMPAIEGSTGYTQLDLVRWGQDGLAALTSTGHIYLVRGPFVVPQLLGNNAAATLTSAAALTHGPGNTLLTLTGGSFVPGVAVSWNGTYRTTTLVDATHLTIALTASDLASSGTATVIAMNPGAAASTTLTVTIQ